MEIESEQLVLFPPNSSSDPEAVTPASDDEPVSRLPANELDGKTWTKYSISIWSDLRKTNEEMQLKHPAMFPLALASRAIACFTNAADRVVLDPFSGVGTTVLAAREAGKAGVGI